MNKDQQNHLNERIAFLTRSYRYSDDRKQKPKEVKAAQVVIDNWQELTERKEAARRKAFDVAISKVKREMAFGDPVRALKMLDELEIRCA